MGTRSLRGFRHLRLGISLCLVVIILGLDSGCQMLFQPLGSSQGVINQPTPDEPHILRVAASWEAMPLVTDLQSLYRTKYPNTILEIQTMESRLARQVLVDGQADLALVVDDPVAQVVTGTQILVENTKGQTVARDALVLAVSTASPLSAITSAQLRDLYAGRIMNWASLGGGSGRPEFVTRESNSSSRMLFERLVMHDEAISTATVVMPSDVAVRDYLVQHPGAIGYLSLTYIDKRLKVVALDGQTPTTETIKSGKYPLIRSIIALINPSPTLEAQLWLTMATSSQGCQLIQYHYACTR
jgi:phosphate transport system substrate-binding protein